MELDGERGLRAARRMQPDLVLPHWMLPNVSGIEICRQLREDPATAATLIIMVTARAETADLARSRAAGANDHIVRPFGRRRSSGVCGHCSIPEAAWRRAAAASRSRANTEPARGSA